MPDLLDGDSMEMQGSGNEVDRQRLFLLRVEGTAVPCPACKRPINVFEAAGVTLDSCDFGRTKYEYRCPACAVELEQLLPFFSGGGALWCWRLKDSWLQEQLRKAREVDRLEPDAKQG